MSKPVILTVDDSAVVLAAIAHDLRGRSGADHRIVRAASEPEGAMSICLVHRYLATI